jgi:hypothetical protein
MISSRVNKRSAYEPWGITSSMLSSLSETVYIGAIHVDCTGYAREGLLEDLVLK